jgi:hypothetical protein
LGLAVDSEENIHLAARYLASAGLTDGKIMYQKNEVITNYTEFNYISPLGHLALAGDKVYMVSGMDSTFSSYLWEVNPENTALNTMTKLDYAEASGVNGMTAADNNIILLVPTPSGMAIWYYDRTNITQTPEKIALNLETGISLSCLAVDSSGVIHLAGYKTESNGVYYAVYVKMENKVVTKTIIEEARSQANGIAVSESGDVYLSGYWHEPFSYDSNQFYNGTALYWKVSEDTLERHPLTETTGSGNSTNVRETGQCIAVDGNDVYVAGYIQTGTGTDMRKPLVYWKIPQGSGQIQTVELADSRETQTAGTAKAIVVR